ncbi:MAG TPA: hypothetical protein VGF67_23585 [Ktedonobacteraceae bacterium]
MHTLMHWPVPHPPVASQTIHSHDHRSTTSQVRRPAKAVLAALEDATGRLQINSLALVDLFIGRLQGQDSNQRGSL